MIDFKEQLYIAFNTIDDGKDLEQRLEQLLQRVYLYAYEDGYTECEHDMLNI